MRYRRRLLALAALASAVCQGAERWRMQYFYDEDFSSLALNDLQFPSSSRGIALGTLIEKSRTRPVVVMTSDGGRRWETARIEEPGLSLFFLNDSLGWMVTEKGIWRTEESGRSWKKIAKLRGALRVHFLDENHGWAVGSNKAVWETHDGGATWEPLKAAAEPKTTPEYTTYSWIEFSGGKFGVIAGASRPPRRNDYERLPDWMEPDRARRRRELPALTVLLETKDAGQHWTASQSSLFGMVTRIRLTPDGTGLGLIQFFGEFDYPSEVFRIDWRTGNSTRVFRQKDRRVTDVAFEPGGRPYLAAVESSGLLAQTPIPGKLKVLTSDNFKDWREMEVDYRATAQRAVLAVAPDGQAWLATDTGMILKLSSE